MSSWAKKWGGQGLPRPAPRWLLLLAALWLASGLATARDVRVGVYQNKPKIFASASGQPSGILGDLLQTMAAQEGWTLQPVICDWQVCLDALQAGKIDLMPDVAYSEQRATLFDFHRVPSLHSWSQLYQRGDARLDSMLDLKNKRLAVLEGSVQQAYLGQLLKGFGLHTELVLVKSLPEAFEKAAAKSVDAAVANRFFGDLEAHRYGLSTSAIMFQPSQLYYATGKGRNADLLSAIDRHLEAWQARPDSFYYQTLTRWMGGPPAAVIPVAVWWSLTALGALLLLALAGGALLRRQVAERTRHLRASEDKLAVILNSVDAAIYIKDAHGHYQYANRKMCESMGRPLDAVVGHADAEFFDPPTVAKSELNDRRVLEHGDRVEEELSRGAPGAPPQTYLSVKLPLRRPDGEIYGLCGIATDITRQKAAEQAIHHLAFYDPLTQLPNRRLLMEQLQHTLAAAARHEQGGALLFIDIDNFKDINDTQGHHIGDQLLQQVAERLRACTRDEDTLARQGGDEFVLVLQGLSTDLTQAVQQADQVGRKILQQLAQPYALESGACPSSVSIGVAMFSEPDLTREELLKQADLAMYRAKADGRNTLRFFDPEMQARVSARTQLEADLRQALASGQFLLHYQAQVGAQGQVLGYEALVRWQHPQRGLVPPLEFIPTAESSGLIQPLGRWILGSACRQLVAWSGIEGQAQWSIAVNVSARQFHQPEFVHEVQQALLESGANPRLLELELTESQLVDDVDSVIARMDALKALGVRLSLDDFGTGYSSLSILKRLPLDQLKIDQTFVRDLLTDPQDASIVRAIVTMGASLGLDVIAEGVETAAQRDALVALGCANFQGYLFGRPAPLPMVA
jgi:diguanylate cyclase (GGDEF)-like protein/PAS domain S-box-containing protein